MTRRPRDSRHRILAAAATAFASHGFDGTSVDDIASRARVNKAMIYYHFNSKNGLYVEIIQDMFRAVGARVRAIAGSDTAPERKIGDFIDAINAEATARPHFPKIMMREMADDARRLDTGTLRLMSVLFASLDAILDQGVAAGVFREADPILTYFSLISPIIIFRATTPVREAMQKLRIVPGAGFDADRFVAHLKSGLLTVLSAGARLPRALVPPAAAPTRRRTQPPRSGDHA